MVCVMLIVFTQILSLRAEKAKILGFKNFSDLSMASKVRGDRGVEGQREGQREGERNLTRLVEGRERETGTDTPMVAAAFMLLARASPLTSSQLSDAG